MTIGFAGVVSICCATGLGTVVGYYLNVRDWKGPRERKCAARTFTVCWALITGGIIGGLLVPRPLSLLRFALLAIGFALAGVVFRRWEKGLARMRQDQPTKGGNDSSEPEDATDD